MTRRLFLLLGCIAFLHLVFALVTVAQAPPGTDILLLPLPPPNAPVTEQDLIRVTNREGYDNQPSFLPDGSAMLYTSSRDAQTDIYYYDLATRAARRLTDTPESEYSPTVLPSGEGFAVVRVETDGTQRLWRFDLDGANPALLFDQIAPVGYQAWADAQRAALFILGDPPTLQLADRRTGRADTIAHRIGRSLHRIPGTRAISFVHKQSDSTWAIMRFDPESGALSPLVETRPGREDYAWHPDGFIVMADGPYFYRAHPGAASWERWADFSGLGALNITRLAVSPNGRHLALVIDRPSTEP